MVHHSILNFGLNRTTLDYFLCEQVLNRNLSKLYPEIRELILQRWSNVINGSLFQSPNDDAALLLFMNHSSDPAKINYDLDTDCAIMDIQKVEEVLEDYRTAERYKETFPFILD